MENDLISRSGLVAELEAFKMSLGDIVLRFVVDRIIGIVKAHQGVDAAEGVHARWVQDPDEEADYIKCSACGSYRMFVTNYCPRCGAKMDGGSP